jgi:hypothetical protein
MFVFWCLVLWGTLFDLSLLVSLVTAGPHAVAAALLETPARGAGLAWANRLSGLLAVLAFVVVLGGFWTSARRDA